MNQYSTTQPILIVEDSDDDFEATVRALKRDGNLGNPLIRCKNGQQALDFLFRQGSFDEHNAPRPSIVLLDLNMPGIDGRAVLKQIKSNDTIKHIPVVVLTTSNAQTDIDACYADGANTYIHKPVELDGFFSAVQQLRNYWLNIAILPKPHEPN